MNMQRDDNISIAIKADEKSALLQGVLFVYNVSGYHAQVHRRKRAQGLGRTLNDIHFY